ncbi:hypothetical protein EYF80_014629 [Liparis tanakae]|uniref:Uncharacterized protein n=1 Tax=Liparis tanakae TaxID=230148 RepID=A0A4Z2IAX5_9TELE|nr:hypothetical protein EYF80_014629 [Liparis tanakae]
MPRNLFNDGPSMRRDTCSACRSMHSSLNSDAKTATFNAGRRGLENLLLAPRTARLSESVKSRPASDWTFLFLALSLPLRTRTSEVTLATLHSTQTCSPVHREFCDKVTLGDSTPLPLHPHPHLPQAAPKSPAELLLLWSRAHSEDRISVVRKNWRSYNFIQK